MRVLQETDRDLAIAADALREGELVAIPTETVYGLAAKGLDEAAVAKIFEAKERPLFDPLILHLPPSWQSDVLTRGLVDVEAMSDRGRDQLIRLAETFWPGPLTIVAPKTASVPDMTTSGLPTVAMRIPRHPIARRLLELVRFPLAAPSANRFGRISPTSVDDVIDELEGRVRLVVDGGRCEIGLESTVARVVGDGRVQLLRPGVIRRSELEAVVEAEVVTAGRRHDGEALHSPGQLEVHYAPSTPLVLLGGSAAGSVDSIRLERSPGLLFQSEETLEAFLRIVGEDSPGDAGLISWRVLSSSGDPAEAGKNLFRMIRELDASPAQTIFAEPPADETGISHAIRDRLERASRGSW